MSLRGVYPQLGVPDCWLTEADEAWHLSSTAVTLYNKSACEPLRFIKYWMATVSVPWEEGVRERENERADKQKRLLPRKREVSEMAGTVNDSQEVQVGEWALYKYNT